MEKSVNNPSITLCKKYPARNTGMVATKTIKPFLVILPFQKKGTISFLK
jgi:hypothetical protein